MVGAGRFELPTPSPPDWCANQAALRSVPAPFCPGGGCGSTGAAAGEANGGPGGARCRCGRWGTSAAAGGRRCLQWRWLHRGRRPRGTSRTMRLASRGLRLANVTSISAGVRGGRCASRDRRACGHAEAVRLGEGFDAAPGLQEAASGEGRARVVGQRFTGEALGGGDAALRGGARRGAAGGRAPGRRRWSPERVRPISAYPSTCERLNWRLAAGERRLACGAGDERLPCGVRVRAGARAGGAAPSASRAAPGDRVGP